MGANIGFQKTTGAKAPIAPVLNQPLYEMIILAKILKTPQ